MNSKIDNNEIKHEQTATEKRSTGSGRKYGCILLPLLLVGVLFASYLIYQKWFAPQVDPNLKSPDIKIANGEVGETPVITEGVLAGFTKEAIESAEHPLEPALALARRGLQHMDKEVLGYSATLVKQIRYKGKLLPEDQLEVKIRHERGEGDDFVPFSVYTKMLSPQKKLGIEAIYVDTWNDNKIIVHPNWPMGNIKIPLPVDGMFAMQEQLHPITMIGLKNLLRQTIEKGERDLAHDECEVSINSAEVDGQRCLLIEITHPEPRDHFEFHVAKIYIDIERQVPLGYEGYLWPEEEGGEPSLFEKYIYTKLKLNPGLDDEDFNPDNEAYNYPG